MGPFKDQFGLVLTCLNEGAVIVECLERITPLLDATFAMYIIVIVDDGSTDDSIAMIEAYKRKRGTRLEIIRHEKNEGRGKSVQDGLLAIDADIVGYIDADLESGPERIPEAIKLIEDMHVDVVLGNRHYVQRWYCLHRYVMTNIYHWLVRWKLHLPAYDTEAGWKFFRTSSMTPILRDMKDTRWFWDTEIVARSYWAGLRIHSLDVPFLRRRDKKTAVHIIRDSLRAIRSLNQFAREHQREIAGV